MLFRQLGYQSPCSKEHSVQINIEMYCKMYKERSGPPSFYDFQ